LAGQIDIVSFESLIKDKLKKGLPGFRSHQSMSPIDRPIKGMDNFNIEAYRKSAVLICCYPHQNEVYTALIKRKAYEGVHSAQFSFPGGRYEDQDLYLEQTALREAEEEVNISPAEVNIISSLTEVCIPVSNFIVYPFLSTTQHRPNFIPDKTEVDFILELPINEIVSTQNITTSKVKMGNGLKAEVPCFKFDEHIVWGATALMLAELKELLG
jgi:8-oxo-dGTP pyrophosphatase MutT (NUDIX family)